MPKSTKPRSAKPKADKWKGDVRRDFLARMLTRAVHYIEDMDGVFDTALPMRAIELDFANYLENGAQRRGRSKPARATAKRSRRKAAK